MLSDNESTNTPYRVIRAKYDKYLTDFFSQIGYCFFILSEIGGKITEPKVIRNKNGRNCFWLNAPKPPNIINTPTKYLIPFFM